MTEDTIDDDPPCSRCLRRIPATIRVAWAAAGVAQVLLLSVIPIAGAYVGREGPAFLRGETAVCVFMSACILAVACVAGGMFCFVEANK
jgi:hypothetical protein